jgi:hypothetical protein
MEGAYFSLTILIINIILWLYFYYKFKKTYSPEKVLKSIRKEVDKLFKEIMRVADEDVSIIEGRIKGLKALIAEADDRIMRAENEVAKRNREKQVLSDLDAANKQELKPKTTSQKKLSQYEQTAFAVPPEKKRKTSKVEEPASVYGEEEEQLEFDSAAESALEEYKDSVAVDVPEELITKAVESTKKPEKEKTIEIVLSKDPITPPKKSTKEQILELHKLDFSPDKISEMLNIPENEVQLAINLAGVVK